MGRYIVTADLHLRADVPLCRKETQIEWLEFQKTILSFIANEANKRDADIIDGGDNFNTPRVQDEIKSLYIDFARQCKNQVHTIPANHTLPYHQKKNINESSIGVMRAVDQLHTNLHVYDCEEMNENGRFEHSYWLTDEILICHTLTFPSKEDMPYFINGVGAVSLLQKYKSAKWIFTGDNHHNFAVHEDERNMINPGTPIIQVADMLEYKPGIYFVDTNSNEIEWITVPNDVSMLTDCHLQEKLERNERLSAFVDILEKTRSGQTKGLSFEDHLRSAMENEAIEEDVRNILEELFMGGNNG